MAIVSTFSSLIPFSISFNIHYQRPPFQLHGVATNLFTKNLTLKNNTGNPKNSFFHGRIRRVRSMEEETQIPEGGEEPVADTLTMFFQAEGTMSESSIPAVTKALELTKQTAVQAIGVASSLIEIIQGSGFKLQTLNLSFKDEEDFAVV